MRGGTTHPGPVVRVIPARGLRPIDGDQPTDRSTVPPLTGGDSLSPSSSLPPSQSSRAGRPSAWNRTSPLIPSPTGPPLQDRHTSAQQRERPGTGTGTTRAVHHQQRSQNRLTLMTPPISTLRSICSECGATYERERSGSRCRDCKPTRERTARRIVSERARPQHRGAGYGATWDRLSKRARRLQPFCSDCGRTDDLTADHSPQAWARQAAGKAIRLEDIDVVCRACNSERGPARGPEAVERPTIGSRSAELAELEHCMTDDDLVPDDLDERIARGEA